MGVTPKNPVEPPVLLTDPAIRVFEGALFRIHAPLPSHPHPAAWNDFRFTGPLSSMRWDPHPPGQPQRHGVGVMYAATDSDTAFAEVFQRRRHLDLTADRSLTIWRHTGERSLRLLDLTSDWPIHNGASASLASAPKRVTRNWAHAIHRQYGAAVDGLFTTSTMTGSPVVVLFATASGRLPAHPLFSRPLTHSAVGALARDAADRFGWPITGR